MNSKLAQISNHVSYEELSAGLYYKDFGSLTFLYLINFNCFRGQVKPWKDLVKLN